MAKKLTHTAEMDAQIAKITGSSDVAHLAVFESIAANTLPISKRGSLFNGGTFTEATLGEMASYVTKNGVPLHIMHNGELLPVGKAFQGGVVQVDGLPEFRVQFYVDPTESDLVSKVDTGTVDAMSVGALQKHLLCSECGWDYMGPDATSSNLYNQTCANDHTIGKDGVRLILSGLDRFYELSFVDNGGIPKAKIVSSSKSLLRQDADKRQLAANGLPEGAFYLTATATPPKEGHNMAGTTDLTQLANDFAAAKVAEATLKASNDTLTTTVTTLTTENTSLKAQVSTLTTDLAAAKAVPAVAEMTKLKDDLAKTTAFLRETTKLVLVANGATEPKVEELTVDAMLAAITEGRTKLSTTILVGGRSVSADTKTDETKLDADGKESRRAAFKTR